MLSLLLILPILVSSAELNIALGLCFLTVIIWDARFSKTLLKTIAPLLLILFIASLSSFFYPTEFYASLKDFFYLLKPILFIVLGYLLLSKIRDKSFLYKIIIYAGVCFALLHLYEVFYYLNAHPFNISNIRRAGGRDNSIELFALLLLLTNRKKEHFSIRIHLFWILNILLFVSFICYFSRTMVVVFFLLLLAIKGYTKLNKNTVIYMSVFISVIALFYAYLYSVDLQRGGKGLEGFFYKMKIAPTEIFGTDINVENKAELWDHWRAYEAIKAFEQLSDEPYMLGWAFGKGLGSLVNLGFVAPLSNPDTQFIPILHNGYAYIIFKTGLLGCIFYLFFLSNLYLTCYTENHNAKIRFINNTISGIAIYFAFTTLIITGIYNKNDIVMVILGAFLYLRHHHQYKIKNEDRNNWLPRNTKSSRRI